MNWFSDALGLGKWAVCAFRIETGSGDILWGFVATRWLPQVGAATRVTGLSEKAARKECERLEGLNSPLEREAQRALFEASVR